ncbi:SDR family oxidoreductase [Streptomyces sp. B93]|uniref:SDR family oxidoreductase n=1 Tax=Streptomyces sp. B93 TaxID=2824875 RepID=UPI001B38CEF2|nr:SDR family oxidoreductase [Streptomyces sp. B93]MBQ1094363.1 SDR family oxidoreductase [Streptomyces sp. B93]
MRSRGRSEVLARETADRGITVNTIQPGPIDEAGVFTDSIPTDSPFRGIQAAGRIADRIGTPDDVADAAEYLAGDLAAWVSGTTIAVTGGLPQ